MIWNAHAHNSNGKDGIILAFVGERFTQRVFC